MEEYFHDLALDDTVIFTVFEKRDASVGVPLGTGTLKIADVMPTGFQGELLLTSSDEDGVVGHLDVSLTLSQVSAVRSEAQIRTGTRDDVRDTDAVDFGEADDDLEEAVAATEQKTFATVRSNISS